MIVQIKTPVDTKMSVKVENEEDTELLIKFLFLLDAVYSDDEEKEKAEEEDKEGAELKKKYEELLQTLGGLGSYTGNPTNFLKDFIVTCVSK